MQHMYLVLAVSFVKLPHIVYAPKFCGHGALQTLFTKGMARNTGQPYCIYVCLSQVPWSCRTSLRNHKFKDKIMKHIPLNEACSPFSEGPVQLHRPHMHENGHDCRTSPIQEAKIKVTHSFHVAKTTRDSCVDCVLHEDTQHNW